MEAPAKRVLRDIWERVYRFYGVRGRVRLGRGVRLGIGTRLWAPHQLTIGDAVYIGRYCTIECDGSIGNGVLVANNVGIVGRYDHDYRCVGVPIRRVSIAARSAPLIAGLMCATKMSSSSHRNAL